MRLDYRSAILVSAFVILLVAALMCAYAASVRPRRKEVEAWAAAYLFLLAGSALAALRGAIPDFLSIVLSNPLLIGFFAAIRVGIFRFQELRPRWTLVWAAAAAIAAWAAFFTYAVPSFPARFYFFSGAIAALSLWSAFSLFRQLAPALAAVSRFSAAILACVGLLELARVALALALGLPPGLMENPGWDAVIQAAVAVLLSVLALTLILLRTEKLNAELAEAVRERELLLREMAHRTKNDLALVESLIALEQGPREGEETGAGPDESYSDRIGTLRERIRCIADAHDRLSRSERAGTVRLDEYLQAVADGLPARAGISIALSFEPVVAPFSKAAPLGLAMNELATNALKHAFPSGRGAIYLSLRAGDPAEGEGRYVLEVRDDGKGASWPYERRGLGGTIVEAFVAKLGGTMGYAFDGGSVFRLSFEIAPPAGR
jgi:two-component sensor histidine kinase